MQNTILVCLVFAFSAQDTAPVPTGSESDSSTVWVNRWGISYGVSNVYPKLKLSERLVDRRINDVLGNLLPGWKRPTTFDDWRDDSMMWDLHLGVGRDINRYASWFFNTASSKGTIHNKESYHSFVLPISTHIDFDRWLLGGIVGMDFYPLAKPPDPCLKTGNRVLSSIMSSRPFIKLALGYAHTVGTGKVRVGIPKTPLYYKESLIVVDDFIYLSPRIGLEVPITANDSILLDAGYLFVPHPNDEYNGLSYYFAHRHKFGLAQQKP